MDTQSAHGALLQGRNGEKEEEEPEEEETPSLVSEKPRWRELRNQKEEMSCGDEPWAVRGKNLEILC